FYVDYGNIVSVGIADAGVLAIGSEYDPVRAHARAYFSGYFLCLDVVNVHGIIQQAGDPKLASIRSKRQSVRESGGSFRLQLSKCCMFGRYFDALKNFLPGDVDDHKSVQLSDRNVHRFSV